MEIVLFLIVIGIITLTVTAYRVRRRIEAKRTENNRLNTATEYLRRGIDYATSNDYNKAIENYEKAAIIAPNESAIHEPNLAAAYYNRGFIYAEKGDSESAMQCFESGFHIDPNPAAIYQFQGLVYAMNGDYDAAIEEYDKAVLLSPDYPYPYYNRAQAYAARDDYDRVITDYSELLRLQPENAGAYRNRGSAYAKKGDYDRSLSDYHRALLLAPDDANSYANRASAYLKRGNHDDYFRAIEDFTKVIEIDPNNAIAFINRGIAFLYSSEFNYDKAIEDLTQAIEIDPNSIGGYINLATAYMSHEDYYEAWETLNEALILDPNNAAAYFLRGVNNYRTDTLYEEGHELEDFDKAIDFAPSDLVSHCLNENTPADLAYPRLCCLAHAYEMRADAYTQLIKTLFREDEMYGRIQEDLTKVLVLIPADFTELKASVYTKRGNVHIVEGEFDSALMDLNKAIRLNAKNEDAYQLRSRAYEKLGDRTKSDADREKAEELGSR